MNDQRTDITGDGNVVGDDSVAQVIKAESDSSIHDVIQIGMKCPCYTATPAQAS